MTFAGVKEVGGVIVPLAWAVDGTGSEVRVATEKVAAPLARNDHRAVIKKSLGERVLGETIGLFGSLMFDGDPLVIDAAKKRLPEELELLSHFSRAKPCSWDDMGEQLRAKYLQLALHGSRQFMPIYRMPFANVRRMEAVPEPVVWAWDLNLSRDVEARAMAAKGGPRAYLKRRLDRRLPHPLSTPYWFAIEFTGSGRLHMHGMFACEPGMKHALENVLYRVAGDLGRHRQFGLEVTPIPDVSAGLGKAAYATKGVRDTRLRTGHKAVATTHDVIREARRLHAIHREAVAHGGVMPTGDRDAEVRHAA